MIAREGRAPPAVAPLTLRRELARKALHVSSLAAPVAWALGLPRPWLAGGLAVLASIALVVEAARARSRRWESRFTAVAGPLLRAHERGGWAGATWMLLAFLGCALLLERRAGIAAMCAVSLGDAAAALVGRRIGRLRLGRSMKTVEGSVACAVVTFLAARFIAGLPLPACAAAATGAALAEALEWRGVRAVDDNVRVAAVTGGAILLWRLAFS